MSGVLAVPSNGQMMPDGVDRENSPPGIAKLVFSIYFFRIKFRIFFFKILTGFAPCFGIVLMRIGTEIHLWNNYVLLVLSALLVYVLWVLSAKKFGGLRSGNECRNGEREIN